MLTQLRRVAQQLLRVWSGRLDLGPGLPQSSEPGGSADKSVAFRIPADDGPAMEGCQ